MTSPLAFLVAIFSAPLATAADDPIYTAAKQAPIESVHVDLLASLSSSGMAEVYKVNMGKGLARFADSLGEEYNRNNIEGLRSIVFCHARYANSVLNADPNMAAFCPMHLTLMHKEGLTTVSFVRPSVVAAESPAHETLLELERKMIESVLQVL